MFDTFTKKCTRNYTAAYTTFVAKCLSNLQLKGLTVCHWNCLFDEINMAEKHVFSSDNKTNIFSFDCCYKGDILIFYRKKGLTKSAANKWMIQTFLIGFPSLHVLVPYKRESKDK